MAIDFPPDLLALESRAWEEIQRGELTVDTALAVHEGVAAFSAKTGEARIRVEAELKRAVRHP